MAVVHGLVAMLMQAGLAMSVPAVAALPVHSCHPAAVAAAGHVAAARTAPELPPTAAAAAAGADHHSDSTSTGAWSTLLTAVVPAQKHTAVDA